MKFKIIILAIMVISAFMLSSCADKQENVRDNVPVSDIAEAVDTQLNPDSFAVMNESYLTGAMKLDTSLFEEFIVKVNAYGANIDEYGIFMASDKSGVKNVEDAVKGYLQMREDTWMDEYMPEEKPKLESAEIKSIGLYVMYAILDSETQSAVFNEFESALGEQ